MAMAQHLIPRITPEMYRNLPDQTTEILNRLVDRANEHEAFLIEFTNEIIAIKRQLAENRPTPPTPAGEYTQVLSFYPESMTSTPGECLVNVMNGFHIQQWASGITGAFEDMLWNQSQGTLHEETYPPENISVPIYIRTGAEHQHVVAWHHGVVYSDGVIIPNWVQYFGEQNIYGWGELCDKIRVVNPVG